MHKNPNHRPADDPHALPADVVAGLAAFFRPIAEAPPYEPKSAPGIATTAIKHTADARRAEAAAILAAGAALPHDRDLAARAVRELVAYGFWQRGTAFYAAPSEVQESIPGGFIARTQCHNLSPEADDLDRMALAVANRIPGLSASEIIDLCI